MKNHFKSLLSITLVAIMTIFLVSCGGSKKATKAKLPSGEEEIQLLCHGPEYQSNATALRYSAIGISMEMNTSKRKALSEARSGLAANIETTIKGVIDNYLKSSEHQNREDLEKRYEGLTREVLNQQLNGTHSICEKMTKTDDGNYKTYVCIELGGPEFLSSLNDRLSKDEMLKIDYDYEKFKKTFDEEMSKLENKK